MHPFSTVESSTASQHVAVRRSSVSIQYAWSWCQANTASSRPGCLASSWSKSMTMPSPQSCRAMLVARRSNTLPCHAG